MLNYNFKWTTTDKPTVPLGPLTVDYSTGLVLVGKGAWQSGVELQNNLLKILDHFDDSVEPFRPTAGQLWYSRNDAAFKVWDGQQWVNTFRSTTSSDVPPAKPQDGELWYDLTARILYVFSSGWQQIYPSPVPAPPVRVAYTDEYVYLACKLNSMIGMPKGNTLQFATGFGQALLPIPVSITNTDWVNLIITAKNIGRKCGVSNAILNSISDTGFIFENDPDQSAGIRNKLQEYTALQNMIEGLFVQRFMLSPAYAENIAPTSGLVTRTTSWSGQITHDVIVSFTSQSEMRSYFNSGANVAFLITSSNTPTSNANNEWSSTVSSIGQIIFSASGTAANVAVGTPIKGFYDLTSTYQLIFTKNTAGTYTTGNLKVEAKQDSVNSVRFLITCTSSSSITSDTTSSQISLNRPTSDAVSSPAISFPTIIKQLTSTW